MGLIANLLKRKSVPEHKVDSSLQMLDMLKQKRGQEIGKYLDLMADPRNVLQSSAPPTIEDLDEREPVDSSVYSPPLLAPEVGLGGLNAGEIADLSAGTGDPIETGINRFFDVFAGQASAYNQNVQSQDLSIGIRRPWHSGETFPEIGGKPVLNACLHTADWGVFFFGHDSEIHIYLLPYHEGSSPPFKDVHVDSYQPLLVVSTSDGTSGRQWYVDGKLLFSERLPDLARDLLDDLVDAHKSHQSSPAI